MNIILFKSKKESIENSSFEVVERKGIGHPDTLADAIAEKISCEYSNFTKSKFGIIPNHWIDKCMLLGGECEIGFGFGKIIRPIKIFVVGKITDAIANDILPVKTICDDAIYDYLKNIFPMIKTSDFEVSIYTNNSMGAGRPNSWYRPQRVEDIKKPEEHTANDASICTAYFPYSNTEKLVLSLEQMLNSKEYKKLHPEIGTDIKIIANRVEKQIDFTMCIPFIASHTPSREFYEKRKMELKEEIITFLKEQNSEYTYRLRINTRDDDQTIYMTHLGSAIDTGDIGVVGRGNRTNGLISPMRGMSIEAPCGKNPVYHSGKLYAVLCQQISEKIFERTQLNNQVYISSETGSKLTDPNYIGIEVNGDFNKYEEIIHDIIHENMRQAHFIAPMIIKNEFQFF